MAVGHHARQRRRPTGERRTITTTTALNGSLDWPGVQQVCRILRARTIRGQVTPETASDLSSLDRTQADAKRFLAFSHDHWGAIENRLHSVRDEAFGEDRCPIFRGDAPQNLAALRNAALNWLRRNGYRKITATLRSFPWNP